MADVTRSYSQPIDPVCAGAGPDPFFEVDHLNCFDLYSDDAAGWAKWIMGLEMLIRRQAEWGSSNIGQVIILWSPCFQRRLHRVADSQEERTLTRHAEELMLISRGRRLSVLSGNKNRIRQ